MLTRNDLIDLIVRHLQAAAPKSPLEKGSEAQPRGRLFLSEWEVKRLLGADGRRLKVPQGAIISPLAMEWLLLKGVEIVRE